MGNLRSVSKVIKVRKNTLDDVADDMRVVEQIRFDIGQSQSVVLCMTPCNMTHQICAHDWDNNQFHGTEN